MTTGAQSEIAFSPATAADMEFIRSQLEGERLDTQRLEPEQFITIREDGCIVALGRVKPYEHTYELGSLCVAPDRRGRGLGEAITRELIRRFPQDEVYLTTDASVGLPAYYERFGFLRTDILPPELQAKVDWLIETGFRGSPVGMIYDRRIEKLPTIGDIYRAKHVIADYLQPTPLVRNAVISREYGFEAYLKLEHLQPIGAFKVRGGVYLSVGLSDDERRLGIIGASTGNHGQSLAYGANMAGVRCTILMPDESNPMKVESMRALGAEVLFHGADFEAAREYAENLAEESGAQFIHHANDPRLITGVATLSLEVMEVLPDVDVIVAPIGGGSGVLAHLLCAKALRPDVEVIAVQAEGARAVYDSWRERCLVRREIDTAAEGLATGAAYYPAIKTLIDRLDDFILVSEDDMREAMLLLARAAHVVAEESGAAATTGAVKLKERLAGKKVAIIVSGGNVPLDHLRRVLNTI
ncbi:MAG TPA: pyridoxal-phosphate dependent enzyme [Dehalococcoidia bacterium]|nr:pyridoxal-phosphate dependent enzyme [Dehalococcoidia bacterium]